MAKFAFEDTDYRFTRPKSMEVGGLSVWWYILWNRSSGEHTAFMVDPRVVGRGFKPIEVVRAHAAMLTHTRTTGDRTPLGAIGVWQLCREAANSGSHGDFWRREEFTDILRRLRFIA